MIDQAEGVAVRSVKLRGATPVFSVVVIGALPFIVPEFYIHLLNEFLILAFFAVSFNLVFGYGKMVSIAHAAFYAAGGYGCGILMKTFGVSLPIALLSSAVLAGLMGLVIGYFSIRLTGFYLAFISLAFGQLVWVVIWKWYDVTGGDNGFIGIPVPSLISAPNQVWRFFYFTLLIVSASVLILWKITRSSFGFSLRATSQNPERTEFVGINVRKVRLLAWMISAFFSGIAGSLMVLSIGGAYPNMAHFEMTLNVTLMALVGGMYTFFGPVVGSAILVFLHYIITLFTEYWMIFMGTILMIIILFLPNGVVGYARERLRR